MRYQRTQIYLAPDEHRRLLAEAKERGISLAALIRETVALRDLVRKPDPRTRTLDAIIGIGAGRSGDVATSANAYARNALQERYQKKMGRRARAKPGR